MDRQRVVSSPPAHKPGRDIRRLRIAMGTWVAFEVSATSAREGQAAIDAAFAAVHRIEELMHPERAGSDVTALNASPPSTSVRVHADTGAVLTLAKRINTLTGGVFDPCLPTRDGRLRDVEIGADGSVVCHKPVALDLGGIAKGYAVDRAVEALAAAGCSSGLVNAGGDLRVFGPEPQTLFVKSVVGLDGDVEFVPIELRETALAVSDVRAQRRPPEHRGYYVRNKGLALPTLGYAAVLAPTTAVADALTKCVLLSGKRTIAEALRALGADVLAPREA
jgi:thiamine biosynthesis lipoprotein